MNQIKEKFSQSQKIITAAFECISSKGYANVSMRDIAEEAGVVLSQLNYYYKNKEGLLKEVVHMTKQKYLQEIENRLNNETTPKERMTSLIMYFREMLEKEPKLFRILYDITGMALWSIPFSELLSDLFEDLADLIEKYILHNIPANNNLNTYSSKSIARMIFGSMFGTAIQVILDPNEEKLPDAFNTIELVFD